MNGSLLKNWDMTSPMSLRGRGKTFSLKTRRYLAMCSWTLAPGRGVFPGSMSHNHPFRMQTGHWLNASVLSPNLRIPQKGLSKSLHNENIQLMICPPCAYHHIEPWNSCGFTESTQCAEGQLCKWIY
jgi:hypothetical protein